MAIIKTRARRREWGSDSMPLVINNGQSSESEEEPIDAIPLRQVPFAKSRPQPSTQTQATVIVKSEPQPPPQYQFGPRMTRSRAKGLTNFKPIKQKKGTMINLSDDSDSPSKMQGVQGSTSRPTQEDSASLNAMADAATQVSTQSIPSTITERLQTGLRITRPLTMDLLSSFPVYPQASVGFMLRKTVDEAMAASNDVLGIRTATCAPAIAMIRTQPSMAAQAPKKGNSSLKHSVSDALAAMDRMIREEPECDPSPIQPPVTTIHAPTITRDIPIEFNFMDSPHFTSIPISSTTVEPTILDHPTTTQTVSKTAHVETVTTSPISSPIQPTTTPSTPTEPIIPLPPTVSIQELDFFLGLSPTNPSLTSFEHNEDPYDPQNTHVTQTPPPSPHPTPPHPTPLNHSCLVQTNPLALYTLGLMTTMKVHIFLIIALSIAAHILRKKGKRLIQVQV
ncbi:mucin-2-like [Cynara cardunculus var. scolymus]|uniref:mucin-2-like n=1 Tax=Cynara cardunculus var. scolymus TaxID=59895 RepID=UPI000D623D03|nr:mucin-2-like [Cynara cardunculus var. scolymus]